MMADQTFTVKQRFIPVKHETTVQSRPVYDPCSPNIAPRWQSYEPPRFGPEQPKVALVRKFPALEFTIHAVAFCITVVVVAINFSEQYWQDVLLFLTKWQGVELKAWQLAAKIHEIFMVTSLSFLVLYYMRKLLVSPRGIPFGLLGSPYVSGSAGMLFQKPFWRCFLDGRRWPFALLLLVTCILSLVLGPSSAIAMIPALDWYQVKDPFNGKNTTTWIFKNTTEIWPTIFNVSSSGIVNATINCQTDPFHLDNMFCPSGGYAEIVKWFVSYTFSGSLGDLSFIDLWSNAQRMLTHETIPSPWQGDTITTLGTFSTVIPAVMLTSLGTFWDYARRNGVGKIKDMSIPRFHVSPKTNIYQPVVYVTCHTQLWDGAGKNVSFPPIGSPWTNDTMYEKSPYVLDPRSEILNNLPSVNTSFSWFKDTRADAPSSLLALSIVPVLTGNTTATNQQGSAVVPCSIDARWSASEVSYQPSNSSYVSSNLSDSFFPVNDRNHPEDFRRKYGISEKPLDLQLDWAQLLDFTGTSNWSLGANTTTMNFLLSIPVTQLGEPNNNVITWQVPNVTSMDLDGAIEEALSRLIGAVIADGLARTGVDISGPSIEENSTPTQRHFTPLTSFLLPNYNYINSSDSNFLNSMFHFDYKVDRYGYGYAIRNTATRAAIACLLFYSVLILVHMLYILSAKLTRRYYGGTSWSDILSLVALAMNSAPTEKLYGTAVGVDERRTWFSTVRVREVGNSHLELVFSGADEGEGAGEMIQVGKKYS